MDFSAISVWSPRATLAGWRISSLRVLGQAKQVREDAVRTRHTVRQLPVESIRVVDVDALAVPRVKQTALLRFLPFVMGFEQCLPMASYILSNLIFSTGLNRTLRQPHS